MTSSTQEQDLILNGLPPLFSDSAPPGNIDWSCLDLCADSASCVTDTPAGSSNPAVQPTVAASGPGMAVPASGQVPFDPTIVFAAADMSSSLWPSEQDAPQQPTQTQVQPPQQQQNPNSMSHHEQHHFGAHQPQPQHPGNAMGQPLLISHLQSSSHQHTQNVQPSHYQELPGGGVPAPVSSHFAPYQTNPAVDNNFQSPSAAQALSHAFPSHFGATQECSQQQASQQQLQNQHSELQDTIGEIVGGPIDGPAPSAETRLALEELSPAVSQPLSDSSPLGDRIAPAYPPVQPMGRVPVPTSLSPMSNVSASTGPDPSALTAITSPQRVVASSLAPREQKHILSIYPPTCSVLAPATMSNHQPAKTMQTVASSGPRENVSVKAPSTIRCASEAGSGCAGGAVSKPVPAKQRRRYNQPRSSKYCHLCARHERAVPMIACGNLYRGLCQKSVCRKCFATYGLDWEAARASLPHSGSSAGLKSGEDAISDAESASASASGANPWLCPHCTGSCPKRAKCFAYDRQTVRRRVKTQEARQHANGSVSVTL